MPEGLAPCITSGGEARGSSVEIQRDLPDHFEWMFAFDDQVDQIALASGEMFDHILCCGPHACICAMNFRG
ncbi:hypothetical protein BV352_03120 [Pseudomonas syringae pv. actinidiae]|nr:hypothetical protein BV352_03120 [Pseudomonas syringae pv. actinidiae]